MGDRSRLTRLGCSMGLWLLAGCVAPTPLHTRGTAGGQAPPAPRADIRHVPTSPADWPLWPTPAGWLIGGSGYVSGTEPPFGVTPGLGLGSIPLPYRLPGGWMVLPKPTAAPSPVPSSSPPPSARPSPSDAPAASSSPLSPPPLPLGFPVAGGTPVSRGRLRPFVVRHAAGPQVVILFDLDSRLRTLVTDLRLPSDETVIVSGSGSTILVVLPARIHDNFLLYDALTGSLDPLIEIQGVASQNSLAVADSIVVFTSTVTGRRHVALYDRKRRMVDPLSRLSQGRETFDAAMDEAGRWIAYVTPADGRNVAEIYDVVTGLVDPLPALRFHGDIREPALSGDGRWLAYIADGPAGPRAYIYDRWTAAIDDLPALAHLGPITDLTMTKDGLILQVNYRRDGRLRVALYVRPANVIDPLPEVNDAGADVTF